MEKLINKKMDIKNIDDFLNLERLLIPVKKYVEEKKDCDIYDDYNEFNNTVQWFENRKSAILNNKDIITAYYIENYSNEVIGIIFALTGNYSIENFLERHNIEVKKDDSKCQLICFHIDKNYRGIGKKFVENYVFEDLKKKNINTVFIKSSHNKALSLYSKLGEKIGNYIGLSEHKLYQRYGYIYRIELKGRGLSARS